MLSMNVICCIVASICAMRGSSTGSSTTGFFAGCFLRWASAGIVHHSIAKSMIIICFMSLLH